MNLLYKLIRFNKTQKLVCFCTEKENVSPVLQNWRTNCSKGQKIFHQKTERLAFFGMMWV